MYGATETAIEQTIERTIEVYRARVKGRRIRKPGRCRVCGRGGHLRWHGSYMRSLITLSRTYALLVKRLLCTLCGHTFALLPEFVLKWHRYAKPAILHAVRMLGRRTYEAVAGLFAPQGERCIAVLTLRCWRREFA